MAKTANRALFLFAKWRGTPMTWNGEGPEPVLTPKMKEHFEESKAKDVRPVGDDKPNMTSLVRAEDVLPTAQSLIAKLEARLKVCKTREEQKALSAKIKRLQAATARVGDASPFERDTDKGAETIVRRESKLGTKPESIAKKYGFDLRFVKEALGTVEPVGDEDLTPFERAKQQAKVGGRVTLKSGFGYHYGQNFGRLSKDVTGRIAAVQGSDIYVVVDGESARWKFPLMAIAT